MKKLLGILVLVSVFGVTKVQAASTVNGGFGGFGLVTTYHDYSTINSVLAASGYGTLNPVDFGWGGCGGFIMHNFFIGGYGFGSVTAQKVENTATGNYANVSAGMGGFEFGYVVAHTKILTIIPTIGFTWGGMSLSTFKANSTNSSFNGLLDNPGTYSVISSSTFSINLGVQTLLNFGGVGTVLRLQYVYTPVTTWGATGVVNVSDAPAPAYHSALLSLGVAFGPVATEEEFRESNRERRHMSMEQMNATNAGIGE